MKLHRKCRAVCIVNAFAGSIVYIFKAFFCDIRINALWYYRVAVVLTGNKNPPGIKLLCRLICSSVTVFQLTSKPAANANS